MAETAKNKSSFSDLSPEDAKTYAALKRKYDQVVARREKLFGIEAPALEGGATGGEANPKAPAAGEGKKPTAKEPTVEERPLSSADQLLSKLSGLALARAQQELTDKGYTDIPSKDGLRVVRFRLSDLKTTDRPTL
jgi:hypothetical protein